MNEQQSLLPNFYGQPVTETELAMSGTIKGVYDQPPEAMTQLGQRRILLVVADVGGASVKRGEKELVWSNKLTAVQAFDLGSSDLLDADKLLTALRQQVVDQIDNRNGTSSLSQVG